MLGLIVLCIVLVIWALFQLRNRAMRGTHAAVAIFGLLAGIACLSWGLLHRSLAVAALGAFLEFLGLALVVITIVAKSIRRIR